MQRSTLQNLVTANHTKIILLVLDGLGGLPDRPGGKTELERASTPNLDRAAAAGISGLLDPIGPGITPGSGPAHFALFGYDPEENLVGRGLLEGAGIGMELTCQDLVARINFATLDSEGAVADRRAGRISTEENVRLCEKIKKGVDLGADVGFDIRPVKEHRAMVLFRTEGLSEAVRDTDPQATGTPPLAPAALDGGTGPTVRLLERFVVQVRTILQDEPKANFVLLRGFAKSRLFTSFTDFYNLRACAIANYPMYRGVAKLLGMDLLPVKESFSQQVDLLADRFDRYDFFFVHVKGADSAGEDGDFQGKVEVIEEVDRLFPRIMELKPDVVAVTGDHSTPAVLKGHSWHPVPVLIHARNCRFDAESGFGESSCLRGGLGRRPMVELMPILMAHAGRLRKFGA